MNFNSDSNVSEASQNQKSILNLDNQTSNNLANLPSGISLTPVGSKQQQQQHPKDNPSSSSVSLTPLTNTTSNALASLQNMQNDSTYMEIENMDDATPHFTRVSIPGQMDNQDNSFGQGKNHEKPFGNEMQNQNQQLPVSTTSSKTTSGTKRVASNRTTSTWPTPATPG
nr:unnamed protein product [Callosobruchus chinensis]